MERDRTQLASRERSAFLIAAALSAILGFCVGAFVLSTKYDDTIVWISAWSFGSALGGFFGALLDIFGGGWRWLQWAWLQNIALRWPALTVLGGLAGLATGLGYSLGPCL
jgi:hypothetical protein